MIWTLLAVVLLAQAPQPVAGQPITFAADHNGSCGTGWATSTIAFQLYVNGTKTGAEAPMSGTPGVVQFTVSGLSAGTHKVEATAICRGTLTDGTAATRESNRSTPLPVAVWASADPLTVPKNVRVQLEVPPEPPPPPPSGITLAVESYVYDATKGYWLITFVWSGLTGDNADIWRNTATSPWKTFANDGRQSTSISNSGPHDWRICTTASTGADCSPIVRAGGTQ